MCPLPFWHIKYVLPIWRKIHKICLLTNGYILDSPGCTTVNIPSFLLEPNLRAEKELMEHSRTEGAQAGATQGQVWPRSTCSEQGPGFGTLWAGTPASSLRIWSRGFRWVVVKFSIFAPAGTEEKVCPSRPSAIERRACLLLPLGIPTNGGSDFGQPKRQIAVSPWLRELHILF